MKQQKAKKKLTTRDLVVLAALSALMVTSKLLMEWLPNVHLIGVLIIAITVVYRAYALYPIYIFVFLIGLFNGFGLWWYPYLYIWTVLWGVTMLLPKKMPKKLSVIVYMIVCGLHGLLFGVLYAPFQALAFGFDFERTLAWIASGLYFDITHCISNVCGGILIVPIIDILLRFTVGATRKDYKFNKQNTNE